MKALLYISIIGLLFFGCRKEHRYEDDPKNSYSTPQERLNGYWKIVDYTLNGTSIYEQMNIKAQGNKNLNNVIFNYMHKSKKSDHFEDGDYFEILPFSDTQRYRVFDDYTFLRINNIGCENSIDSLFSFWFISPQQYNCNTNSNWLITKLYKDDFHMTLKTNSGEYKIMFIKTKL